MSKYHLVWVVVLAFVLGALFPAPVNFVRSKVGV